jgi:recombination protein RecR
MNVIDELIEVFRKFPGVGPRQAERFVYYLLRQRSDYLQKISTLLPSLANQIDVCNTCCKFYVKDVEHKNPEAPDHVCKICSDVNRHKNTLMIVARDVDLQSVEKSGNFNGVYFVLGGMVPIMDKNPGQKIRLNKLKEIVTQKIADGQNPLQEIIVALSANPEGENTTDIIKKELKGLIEENNIKISVLGRGLSTGSELEYSDSETIKNALENRF